MRESGLGDEATWQSTSPSPKDLGHPPIAVSVSVWGVPSEIRENLSVCPEFSCSFWGGSGTLYSEWTECAAGEVAAEVRDPRRAERIG